MDIRLARIYPHIYYLRFDSAYQLAMHFLRAQEYYESPKFRGKLFTIVDYMEWYSGVYGKGTFTYPKDWSGFNVPSWVLHQVYAGKIPDPNKYDDFMESIIKKIVGVEGVSNFYLIGTSAEGHRGDKDETSVLSHEIAHGLYYTNKEYNDSVQELLNKMDRVSYSAARKVLADMGYDETTQVDEVHAYASTGLTEKLEPILTPEICAPFVENFTRWLEKLNAKTETQRKS